MIRNQSQHAHHLTQNGLVISNVKQGEFHLSEVRSFPSCRLSGLPQFTFFCSNRDSSASSIEEREKSRHKVQIRMHNFQKRRMQGRFGSASVDSKRETRAISSTYDTRYSRPVKGPRTHRPVVSRQNPPRIGHKKSQILNRKIRGKWDSQNPLK